MKTLSPSTLAEASAQRMPGKLVASSSSGPWKDLMVRIYSLPRIEQSIIVPAVAEPLIVWVLSGDAVFEERELGGEWQANRVKANDFFLTTSPTPYELRWKIADGTPFEALHLYLGLPIFRRAIKEVLGRETASLRLREISGGRDPVLSAFLGQLHQEFKAPHQASALFVQGIAQSLAVHLVRRYADESGLREQRGGLPAFKLRKVTDFMEAHLAENFRLGRLSREAGMSEFHFCRLFRKTTGLTPTGYFIRLRMEKARALLRETSKSVLEVGLDVGYSSPSHFTQIFQREVGILPSEYRRRD